MPNAAIRGDDYAIPIALGVEHKFIVEKACLSTLPLALRKQAGERSRGEVHRHRRYGDALAGVAQAHGVFVRVWHFIVYVGTTAQSKPILASRARLFPRLDNASRSELALSQAFSVVPHLPLPAIPLPGGMTIGTLMAVNLLAAWLAIQSAGQRLAADTGHHCDSGGTGRRRAHYLVRTQQPRLSSQAAV
jgi:hypothetical protein